tara:strand:+ start:234 stop:380 length:147 start_codon:yes stop_codon:yes gene_type:complete
MTTGEIIIVVLLLFIMVGRNLGERINASNQSFIIKKIEELKKEINLKQ